MIKWFDETIPRLGNRLHPDDHGKVMALAHTGDVRNFSRIEGDRLRRGCK